MITSKLPENIVSGLTLGDEETYISLFREYYVALCSYARRYVGRKDIAEEIVSDTFLKIWETRKSLQINSSVKAYLFQAVCNNSLSYLRKLKKDLVLDEYFMETASENIGFSTLAEEMDEQSLAMENTNAKIIEAINQLPEQQQKVFRLKRFEGKKNKEVAEMLGLSVKTVEMHLSKATLNLRVKLKDYLPPFLIFLLLK